MKIKTDWNFKELTKKELIHLLEMTSIQGGKKAIWDALREFQFGTDVCKTCKSIYKKQNNLIKE